MQITLRKAKKSDAANLSTIANAAKKHWGYPNAWMELWAEGLIITPEFIQNNTVWVAQDSDEIVGFVAICIQDVVAQLEHLWVIPEHMRKGIGNSLLIRF
jgi:ribosomal protein S18 acetylase RimI-like enzyme